MTPTSHPDAVVLVAFAGGHLDTAPRLVIGAHLRVCATCRRDVRTLELVGGALLANLPPAPLEGDPPAFALIPEAEPAPGSAVQRGAGGQSPDAWPRGPRLRFPNGVWVARLRTPVHETWRALMIGAPPGFRLPEHRHRGFEYTCVLEGELEDGAVVYRAGDFADGGMGTPHRVRVSANRPGVALKLGHAGRDRLNVDWRRRCGLGRRAREIIAPKPIVTA